MCFRFFNSEDNKMRNEENADVNVESVQDKEEEEEAEEHMKNLVTASLTAVTSATIEKKMFTDVQSVERLRTLVNNIIQSASRVHYFYFS